MRAGERIVEGIVQGVERARSRRAFLIQLSRRLGGIFAVGLGISSSACDEGERAATSDNDLVEAGTASSSTSGHPLARAIESHFDYLDLDAASIASFVRDYESSYGPWKPDRHPQPFTRFLASTDFFQHGADETRRLRYVAFFDPYVSPCYDPFSPAASKT